jgi:hypothetical protein
MRRDRLRNRRWSIGEFAAAATVLAVVLTGCTGDQAPDYKTPKLPSNFSLANVVLPLDSYQLSDSELTRMGKEWSTLMTRCAATFGETINYSSDYTRPADDTSLWGGPFGTLSKKQASQFGYHAPPGAPAQPAAGIYLKTPDNIFVANTDASPLDQLISYGKPKSKDDPAYSLPLPTDTSGSQLPPKGCLGMVQDQIGAPLVSDLSLRNKLISLSFDDSRTQKAITEWSTCMKSHGFTFGRPQDAEATAGRLNAAETAQAEVDVDCTQRSKWSTTYYAILIDYQKQAEKNQGSFLRSVLDSQKRVLKRLDDLV